MAPLYIPTTPTTLPLTIISTMGASSNLLTTLPLLLTLTLLTQSLATATPTCSAADQSSTLQIYHIYSPCSPFRPSTPLSWEQSVLQMQSNDKTRLVYLSSLLAGRSFVPIGSGRQVIQSPTYIVRAKIGTPAQTMLMAVDTSNDAAWLPCAACVGCPNSYKFNPAKSTSYKPVGCGSPECKQVQNPTCGGSSCSFNMTYGSSSIAANLSKDNFTLAMDSIKGYTFGCINKATGNSVPPQGLLGLGRGPLSLLSQTQSLYQSTFSYCLPSFKSLNFSGTLRLGTNGQPKNIKFTPLLKNPRRSSLYYVNLIAIRVGRKIVDIPPSALAFNPTTGAGTIIDSGTVFTRLVEPAYTAVRNEFRRRMGKAVVSSLGGFDTCYTVPITVPTITFIFQGMNFTMPQDNFLIHSVSSSTACLAMAVAPDNVNSVLNVIANMQQQNHRILFDVPNSRVGVSREFCT